MNTIDLKLIKPSPNPVRKTWDEDKMNELAQSIKERGVIVPIKVRPVEGIEPCPYRSELLQWPGGDMAEHGFNILTDGDASSFDCDGCARLHDKVYGGEYGDPEEDDNGDWIVVNIPFEVVYGHRRVEAARRAGLVDIPALVEGVDDTDALIQALIENVQREDMHPLDEAQAYHLLCGLSLTIRDVSNMTGKAMGHISQMMSLLKETETVQGLIGKHKGGAKIISSVHSVNTPISETHVREVRASKLENPNERESVLVKAATEELTYRETRAVADAYKAAETPELKQALIETPYHTPQWEEHAAQVAKVRQRIARQEERKEAKRQQEHSREVKAYLAALSVFTDEIKTAIQAAKTGRFSPEAVGFVKGWHDSARTLINDLESVLEGYHAKVQK